MSLQRLDSLLPRQINQLHLKNQVEGPQVCKLWHEYAKQFFLSNTMENHEAINFRDGVLTILTTNPAVAEEIRHHQPKIIALVNRALGHNLITSIRFRF